VNKDKASPLQTANGAIPTHPWTCWELVVFGLFCLGRCAIISMYILLKKVFLWNFM
jgi:hypothetical protein